MKGNIQSSSEHAPSKPHALPPPSAELVLGALDAAGVGGRWRRLARGARRVRVVLSRAGQDFVWKHGQVEAEAIVPVAMHLASLASGAGETAVAAESAERAVAAASDQLGFAHCGEDG